MRVLLISLAPVNRAFGSGNTFLNVMEHLDGVELAAICARSGETDPRVSRAFYVTERMLIRNRLKGTPAGVCVHPDADGSQTMASPAEAGLHRFAHRHRWTVLFWARELLWRLGRWRSPELEAFLTDFKPDVIFTFLAGTPHINRLILHAAEVTGAKLALYAWDNNYTYRQFTLSPLRWIKQCFDRIPMRQVAARADRIYVICEELKAAYDRAFGRDCHLLTKGADFSGEPPVKAAYNRPLQLVYTGNLQNNRWRSLAKIARVLERINRDGLRARLSIYTGSPLTKTMIRALNRGEASAVMGSVLPSEVARLQSEADILVHAEATDLKNHLAVRHSFSTKLVDYLAAARPILAYGKRDAASIRYLADHDCAIVAESPDELYRKLTAVLEDTSILDGLARRAYTCGKRHHEKTAIREMLTRDFANLLNQREDE
ncbi:MAG: glycosyltransferase [Clostridia bacterium]|nr:glycosyltransferase [Clostridia bacterium]